ncbi:MAG: alpha-hydroxy-acid oxidizing protein [Deltaproteobacteria bacterium]|nr:alpha-hydroxy-acid oxidizing protein [Deltaproteobacteria bacterium]
MARYICQVCEYIYDEDKEVVKLEDLSDDWDCPVCRSNKKLFNIIEEIAKEPTSDIETATAENDELIDLSKTSDDLEIYLSDIHQIAETGQSISEPMRTAKPIISWDDVLIKGAQLAKMPLNQDVAVNSQTIIGLDAKQPMIIETPIYITHMSFGALSKEAKISLAKGSAAIKTAICSGEGGVLPESRQNAYKYIFEFVPNQYSATEEIIKSVDAIEIKIGQSAKPGMGGHLPGNKVTKEIADIRGFKEGEDIISPARFEDITNKEELKQKVDWLREISNGRPVGIKFAAGNIEADLGVALFANPDFITIDGRAGATGSAPKVVKESTSVPTLFALYRARKFLDQNDAPNISLVITGGLRMSSDFAKALALGADAVAIGTSALIAIGCQQYRVCNTGRCPIGIATQDPVLRKRLDIEKASKTLKNYLNVSTEELKNFARLTGNNDVHHLSVSDLCTTNTEISNHTSIEHV